MATMYMPFIKRTVRWRGVKQRSELVGTKKSKAVRAINHGSSNQPAEELQELSLRASAAAYALLAEDLCGSNRLYSKL